MLEVGASGTELEREHHVRQRKTLVLELIVPSFGKVLSCYIFPFLLGYFPKITISLMSANCLQKLRKLRKEDIGQVKNETL